MKKESLRPLITNCVMTYLGFYTKDKPDNDKLDIVIVEATAVTEDGWIVPGASVGATPELLQMADKIIIEVNTRIPSFEGLHDINMCSLPPYREPYMIRKTDDRIGTVSKDIYFRDFPLLIYLSDVI